MAGTRTAPTVDGTPTFKQVSISLIDAQGDIRSVSLYAKSAATVAEIEAMVAAQQAITNASIYQVSVSDVYNGARQTSNADDAVVNSVYSNIVYHVKASPSDSQRGYVPAPLDALFDAGTDTVDLDNALLGTWFASVLAVVGSSYTGQSVRYTERREINDAQKF